jgi:tetratricopeptide (TPR) repeat protein
MKVNADALPSPLMILDFLLFIRYIKKMNGKVFALFLLFCFSSLPARSQVEVERPYWFIMEQGKRYFRSGDYGNALIAFEDARNRRRAMYTRMEQDMIAVLSIAEVRRLGDALDLVERYIAERGRIDAARALEELYYRVPKEDLNNSAERALAEFDRLKAYPEAEYWIGEAYRVEGELGIALKQFQKAYEQRSYLETPAFETEILYKIADIHRIRQEYTLMERSLLEILKQDSLWSQDSGAFVRSAMARTLENDGIDRFLTLYRYNNPLTIRAHRLLGFYYSSSGRHSRAAEHLLFAFLIQNSIFIDEMIRLQYGYTFTTLDNLLDGMMGRPVLASYFEGTDYYKVMYYLGAAFFGSGKLNAARRFWDACARRQGAGEWRVRSQAQLTNPFVEKAVELP